MDPYRRLTQTDIALVRRMATVDSPFLDRTLVPLSRIADHSVLWLFTAAVMAMVGTHRTRRTALHALVTLTATSLITNQAAKRVTFRHRPDRQRIPARRRLQPKQSSSFPSGHTASAFAFTVVAGIDKPQRRAALAVVAAAVGLSRVFTGMHYPSDVLAGAVLGTGMGIAAHKLIVNHIQP